MARFARLRAGLSGLSVVICGAAALGVATPAAAQGFGWFGNLFGGGGPHPLTQPRYPGGYNQQQDYYQPRRRAPRRQASEPARTPREKDSAAHDTSPKAPPKDASVFVYVFGDSFGQSLAGGLDDALADRQDVAVVHKAKGSSGLVASDFYDWPKAIDDVLAENRKAPAAGPSKTEPGKTEPDKIDQAKAEPGKTGPTGQAKNEAGTPDKARQTAAAPSIMDVAVMMIGSNDRQPLRVGGKTLAVGTPEWTAAYQKRVMAIDEAFRRRNIPLVWVGMPIARDDDFADDMAAFNDVYREAAAKTGAVYVDTWEAFSDDKGDFSPLGPDINGQIVRLRTADGVYFTKAGGRKLAHFVEAHVRRAIDGKLTRPLLPASVVPSDTPVPRKPDAGPISSLTEPPSARDGRLASSYHQDVGHDQQVEPEKDHPPEGRADDLRWPAGRTPNP